MARAFKRQENSQPGQSLNLAIKSCCGEQPMIRFNQQGELGIFCPHCKKAIRAGDGEMFLEIINKWNKNENAYLVK